MAQPAFDDSIEKLGAFCTLLGQTSAVLDHDSEVLDARGDSLDRTGSDTRKRCEEIADRLEAARDEVGEAHEDALAESDRLNEGAHDLAADRLTTTEDSLESARSSFEERLEEDRAELEGSFQGVFASGFTPLSAAIDEMETGMAGAGENTRQALEALEQAFTEAGRHAGEQGTSTVAALQQAEGGVAQDGDQLESQGTEHTELWTEALPDLVRAECASVAEPLEALYGEWEAEVVAEGDELSESVAGLLEDAADIVTNDAGQPLAAAMEETLDHSFTELSARQDALMSALTEGEPASEAAAALVDDLVVARQLVSEIDRLLNAIAE